MKLARTYLQLKEKLAIQSKVTDELLLAKNELERAFLESSASLETKQAIFNHTLEQFRRCSRTKCIGTKNCALNQQKNEMDRAGKPFKNCEKKEESNSLQVNQQKFMQKHLLSEAEEKKANAKQRFIEALEKSEFPTEEAYQEAKMDEASRNTIENMKLITSNNNIMLCEKQ